MEVILKEDVANLGFRGEVVKVADGYARNFLLPRKLAMQATDTNKAVIEQMKVAAARRSASEKSKAEEFAAKLDTVALSFSRKAGEAGHLFGSVTSADIATELAAQAIEVDRRKIQLGDPLKSVGEFTVAIRLHREVTARLKVKVQAEESEEKKEPGETEKKGDEKKPAEPAVSDEAIGPAPPAEQTQFD
jgi:large subunit ribosomal protein L9